MRSRTLALAFFAGLGGERTFARQLECCRLAGLDTGGDFDVGVGLSGKRRRLVDLRRSRGEFDGFRGDGDKVLDRVDQFGIDVDAAGVGHRVNDAEAGFAGAKREEEGVAIPGIVAFGDRIGFDGLATGGHGLAFFDLGSIRDIELEVVLVHLRAGRLGVVLHGEGALDLELSSTGLEAHDVGDDFDAIDFLTDVVDFDFDRSGSRRGHAVIGDFLMDDADEVRALAVKFETEVAFGVGLGASGFFHALTEAEENDLVTGGRLARGGVFDRAGEGLGGGQVGEEQEGQDECHTADMWRQPPPAVGPGGARLLLVWRECCRVALDRTAEGRCPHINHRCLGSVHGLAFLGADAGVDSRCAISARSVAASSCKDDFSDW